MRTRNFKRRRAVPLQWAAALLLFAIFFAASVPAFAEEIVIQHFDEQIRVLPNGTIEVTETIEAHFTGSWHGLYRTIPIEYTTPQGMNYKLSLDSVNITDGEGRKLRVDKSSQGRYTKFKIYVPDAADATRTIVIHYRVLDALRFFEDHDELYWNVTGDEWENSILLASAQIELPAGVKGLRATSYTGGVGSRANDALLTIEDDTVNVHTTRPLAYHEGLTVVVGFDKGAVTQPSGASKFWRTLGSNWPILLPFLALIGMLRVWWTRGRDPDGGALTVQYEPPDNLTPGECGTIVDNSVDMRDVTATLVDLAVKGYLTIEQKEESHLLGLTHSKSYTLHLKKQVPAWIDARPHEKEMLSALFDDGVTTDVDMSSLQNHFYVHIPAIKQKIFDALIGDKYYLHRPDTVKQGYIFGGVTAGIIMAGASGVLSSWTGMAPMPWIIAAIGCGAAIAGVGAFMSGRTAEGARAREKVLGFEEFLGRVEKDRMDRIERTPELFEKFLPYAMALRVEKKWVAAFAGIAMAQPQWYSAPYGTGFQPLFLVNDLNFMTSQAATAMTAAPRSSGGSGFGGGGFSGGGFGGGGGGGF